MNKAEESLVNIGLTPTEAALYLAGVSSDLLTIQELCKKTKIKRPTIYHAIGTLIEKGLVSEKKVGNKLHFSMSAPEHMRALVEREREAVEARARTLDELIPLLAQQKKSSKKENMNVLQYSGIEGMKMVMDIAFYCKSRRWDIIAPYNNFLREYDKDYAKRYLNARKYHGITSRTLWESGVGNIKKLSRDEIEERNPRRMPRVMQGKFKSMMILFDDKIAIFSSYEKLSAVLITAGDMQAMFQAIFDGLWEVSERL